MPKYIDTEIESLREGLRSGYSLPRANARSVVEQIDALLKYPPAESPFAAITKRDSTPEFKAAVVKMVAEEIAPALKRYRDFLAPDRGRGRQCWPAALRHLGRAPADRPAAR